MKKYVVLHTIAIILLIASFFPSEFRILSNKNSSFNVSDEIGEELEQKDTFIDRKEIFTNKQNTTVLRNGIKWGDTIGEVFSKEPEGEYSFYKREGICFEDQEIGANERGKLYFDFYNNRLYSFWGCITKENSEIVLDRMEKELTGEYGEWHWYDEEDARLETMLWNQLGCEDPDGKVITDEEILEYYIEKTLFDNNEKNIHTWVLEDNSLIMLYGSGDELFLYYMAPYTSFLENSAESKLSEQEIGLSSLCDCILCEGYDKSGNKYELVANQTESTHGFEITVGVIKNNTWIYPLSNDFPFLAEDGLFHVSVSLAGESGTSLYDQYEIINNLYFIDSGAFLMECFKANSLPSIYDHFYIIFSCVSLNSTKINCAESTLLYRCKEPSFFSGHVESYGQIFTDKGRLILFTETSGVFSGWLEDQVFKWDVLDISNLTTTTIASNVKGVCPKCILSEDMFFCTDKCFYNTKGLRVVDLSEYTIDMWESDDVYFMRGICTFKAQNSLGTRFLVTIDSSGSFINEEAA